MKYIKLGITILTLLLQSCTEDDCMVVGTAIQIYYIDEDGKDILDPQYSNPILAEELEIYYLSDGEKVRVYDPNMDNPKNFSIKTDGDGRRYVSLTVSHYLDDGVSTTYLKVADRHMMDVLRTEIYQSECVRLIKKAWYNDQLLWEGQSDPIITIIKKNPPEE